MNACIQCLSNIPPFRDFFLEKQYKQAENSKLYNLLSCMKSISIHQLIQ